MSLSCRTLWLSDVHLGSGASKATDLLHFLEEIRPERMYLVGDIIDLERMRNRPQFPGTHRDVIRTLITIAQSGADVVYMPGNHDSELREIIGQRICGIPVVFDSIHELCSGARLLVMHGDILDGRIRGGTHLEQFGAAAYGVLMDLDATVNTVARRLGFGRVPIGTWVKQQLAAANDYIRRFEVTAIDYAAERGFDGVVCGHIHKPALLQTSHGIYANDGDWVEHCTALAELDDGSLELLQWRSEAVTIARAAEPRRLAA